MQVPALRASVRALLGAAAAAVTASSGVYRCTLDKLVVAPRVNVTPVAGQTSRIAVVAEALMVMVTSWRA